MSSMSKRQNAGEYNNGFPPLSSNSSRFSMSSQILQRSLPASPPLPFLHNDFRSLKTNENQSSCQNPCRVRYNIPASYECPTTENIEQLKNGGAIAPQSLLLCPISQIRRPRQPLRKIKSLQFTTKTRGNFTRCNRKDSAGKA